MFDNIEQLEKEITEFRQNILASKDLLSTIRSLVDAMKQQSSDVQTTTSSVVAKLDAQVLQLKNYSNSTLQGLISRLDSCLEETKALASKTAGLISEDNKALMKKTVLEIKHELVGYLTRLDEITWLLSTVAHESQAANTATMEKCDSVVSKVQSASQTTLQAMVTRLDHLVIELQATAEKTAKEVSDSNTKIMADTVTDFKFAQIQYLSKLDETIPLLASVSAQYVAITESFAVKCDVIIASFQESIKVATDMLIASNQDVVNQIKNTHSEFATKCDSVLAELQKSTQASTDVLIVGNQVVADQIKSTQREFAANCDLVMAELQKSTQASTDVLIAGNQVVADQIKTTQREFVSNCEFVLAELQKTSQASTNALIAGNQGVADQIKQTALDFTAATNDAIKRIDQKEAALAKKIEDMNYEELLKTCVGMKKSMETKITLLMAGLGVSVLLSILALILK